MVEVKGAGAWRGAEALRPALPALSQEEAPLIKLGKDSAAMGIGAIFILLASVVRRESKAACCSHGNCPLPIPLAAFAAAAAE